MELDSTKVKRLSFIKYLYKIGLNQSENANHLAGAALLTFHDSAELFLQLASEHLDKGKSKLNFMEYWKVHSDSLPDEKEMSQKESMRRLNKARVALKHHGTHPSKTDLEAFRATITNFFKENCALIFDLEFDSISMIDFIEPESARSKLKKAQKLTSENKLEEALDKIIVSFEMMLKDYEERKTDKFNDSPFFFGEDLHFYDSFFIGLDGGRGGNKMGEFVDRVKNSIESMQEAIKILALGIDYRKYSRFKLLTPNVQFSINDKYRINRHSFAPKEKADKEDVKFCIDFVVESALKLREFDYSLNN